MTFVPRQPLKGLQIATLGGWCPVQAEGAFDNRPFYFRARGDQWSVQVAWSIGLDPVVVGWPRESKVEGWSWTGAYGKWPEAGYMEAEEAIDFITRCFKHWKKLGGKHAPYAYDMELPDMT